MGAVCNVVHHNSIRAKDISNYIQCMCKIMCTCILLRSLHVYQYTFIVSKLITFALSLYTLSYPLVVLVAGEARV